MTLLDEQGERLYATLARLTLRHDVAADLLQELFLRLSQSSTFAAADDPAAYARRTAINLAMEWRRRERARQRVQGPVCNDAIRESSGTMSPLERLVRAEEYAQVLDGLSKLSELARACFVLRLIERQPYEQIARQLGKNAHQVRGLCHAALRQLRDKLNVARAVKQPRGRHDDNV